MTHLFRNIFLGCAFVVLLFSALIIGYESGALAISMAIRTLDSITQAAHLAAAATLVSIGIYGGGLYTFVERATDGLRPLSNGAGTIAMLLLWAAPAGIATGMYHLLSVTSFVFGSVPHMLVVVTGVVSSVFFVGTTIGGVVLLGYLALKDTKRPVFRF